MVPYTYTSQSGQGNMYGTRKKGQNNKGAPCIWGTMHMGLCIWQLATKRAIYMDSKPIEEQIQVHVCGTLPRCYLHGAMYMVPYAWCHVHGAICMVPYTRCHVHGAMYKVPCTWCHVHGAICMVRYALTWCHNVCCTLPTRA